MGLASWHREDVKAVLRRRYGSVFAFEKAKGLPRASVSDVLRGRRIERTETAILEELMTATPCPAGQCATPENESDLSDNNTTSPRDDRAVPEGPHRPGDFERTRKMKGLRRNVLCAVGLMTLAIALPAHAQTGRDLARALLGGLLGANGQAPGANGGPVQPQIAGSAQYDTPPGVQPKGAVSAPGCDGIEVVRYSQGQPITDTGLRLYYIELRNRLTYAKVVTVYVERQHVPAYARTANLVTSVKAGEIVSMDLGLSDSPPKAVTVLKCQ